MYVVLIEKTVNKAKQHNENLPGMGGLYNLVNMHVYHFTDMCDSTYYNDFPLGTRAVFRSFAGKLAASRGNGEASSHNPVRYVDSDGRDIVSFVVLITWGVEAYKLFHRYSVKKGNEIYERINNNEAIKCSSMNLYHLYTSGQGRSVTLNQIGLLETIQNAVQSGTKNTKSVEPIQSRFIAQLKSNDGTYFERSYEFENEKFAIGKATISGKFDGSITENANGTVHIEGTITYSFSDIFTDPYDTFNITKNSEWNPDGKPYKITDTWTVKISGDY